jgi:glycosyltransferase involved in cell wall biosynthesis
MSASIVSIVIPTYKPHFLEQAVDSALAQTFRSTEIVVSDHCPGEEVHRIVSRYPNIRYQRNLVSGVYSNFRNCMRLARGEFVKFLLDDDLLAPNCVERLVKGFRDHKGATLVSSWYQTIDENDKEIELRRFSVDHDVVSSAGGSAAPMLVAAKNPIGPLTTSMFRRRSFPLGLGPWFFQAEAPTRYFGLMDMAIILDLAFQGRTVVIAEPLSAMRTHPQQLSNPDTNPRVVHSLTSWIPLAEDAYAYGLISHQQRQEALKNILEMFRRFLHLFPVLAEDIADLEVKLHAISKSQRTII